MMQRLPLLARCPLILAVMGILALPAGAATQAPSLLYEQALSAFSQGKLAEAAIDVKNALLEDPGLISAHILLAKIYLEVSQGSLAEKELVIAERLGASRTLTTPLLARAYLAEKKYQTLIDSIFPTGQSKVLDAEILERRGAAYLELRQADDALESYAKAAALVPGRAAPLLGRATVYLRDGKMAGAEAEVAAAIAQEPGNAEAWYTKGTISHAQGQLADALAGYEKAIALRPSYLEAQVARAGVLMDLGRLQDAKSALSGLSKDHPKDPRLAYLLAVTLARLGEADPARALLKEAGDLITGLPKKLLETHAPTVMLGALVRYGLGQKEQAYQLLQTFLRLEPGSPMASKLMGEILLSKGEVDKAVAVLEPALPAASQDVRLLTLLGRAYSQQGKYVQAAELLDRALRVSPGLTAARTYRAYNDLARGNDLCGLEELGAVFQEHPDAATVGLNLYMTLMRHGNYDKAIAVARKLVVEYPASPVYLTLLGEAQGRSGDLAAAKGSYDQALTRNPDFLPAQINLGIVYRLTDGPAKAVEYFTALARQQPKDTNGTRLALELARSLHAAGRSPEAVQLLKKTLAEHPDALDALVLLTDIDLKAGRPADALAVAESGARTAPSDHRVLGALGRAYLALDRRLEARQTFRRISTEAGYDARQLLWVAGLQAQAGDLAGATWSLQKAVQGDPDLTEAQVRLTYLLLGQGKADLATQQAEALRKAHPDKPLGDLLLGDIQLHQGDPEQALARYQAAQQTGGGAGAYLGMLRAQVALGRLDAALALAKEASRRFPRDMRIRQAAGEMFLRQGRWELARREYEYVVQHDPKLGDAANNLAVIYDRSGDLRALTLARKAVELLPQSASANDTLGWILTRQGEAVEGLKYLRNATALRPDSPEIHYHLAGALQKAGLTDEARRELDKVLAGGGKQAWRADAEALRARLK
jgi:putative PEP-CTERM system TPR-repeat lipoprotein